MLFSAWKDAFDLLENQEILGNIQKREKSVNIKSKNLWNFLF